MTEEQENILSLYGVPGVGAKTFARLTAHFGSPGTVFEASSKELMRMDGIGPVIAKNILTHDRQSYISDQKRRMEKFGAVLIHRSGEDYPPLLDAFPSAPPVLFARGNPQALKKTSIAVVGTRKPSSYGIRMTRKLVTEAVEAKMCVVSGMAAGIDSTAHRAALDAGGETVAVFGCGVDIIYPAFNRKLSEEIMKSGCLVSHFPMGTVCIPGNFPARNSVIVGLSLGTIVVEAPKKSGALITADLTLKAGRKLFTIPGNVDSPSCEGTNSLLTKGAHPVSSMNAVLSLLGKSGKIHTGERLHLPVENRPVPKGLAGDILKTLDSGPLQMEFICNKLGKPVSDILRELTMLEIDGYVRQKPGKIIEKV